MSSAVNTEQQDEAPNEAPEAPAELTPDAIEDFAKDPLKDKSSVPNRKVFLDAVRGQFSTLVKYSQHVMAAGAESRLAADWNIKLRLAIRIHNGQPDLAGNSDVYTEATGTYLVRHAKAKELTDDQLDEYRSKYRSYMSDNVMLHTMTARWVIANDPKLAGKYTDEQVETMITGKAKVPANIKAAIERARVLQVSVNGKALPGFRKSDQITKVTHFQTKPTRQPVTPPANEPDDEPDSVATVDGNASSEPANLDTATLRVRTLIDAGNTRPDVLVQRLIQMLGSAAVALVGPLTKDEATKPSKVPGGNTAHKAAVEGWVTLSAIADAVVNINNGSGTKGALIALLADVEPVKTDDDDSTEDAEPESEQDADEAADEATEQAA